jgi:predicted nucleic acid-binding protein
VSFPLIRPADVEAMTGPDRERLLARLRQEIAAAAVRHREILAARKAAEEAAQVAYSEARITAQLAGRDFTDVEWIEAEQVLRARRVLVRQGRRPGDGSRADDLMAAHAAVRAGSRNPYLLALNRERNRLAKEASRNGQQVRRARQPVRTGIAS